MNCPCPRRTLAPRTMQFLRSSVVKVRASRLAFPASPPAAATWQGSSAKLVAEDPAGKTKPARRGGPVHGLSDGCETVSRSRLLLR
jgi:hypothetical protein